MQRRYIYISVFLVTPHGDIEGSFSEIISKLSAENLVYAMAVKLTIYKNGTLGCEDMSVKSLTKLLEYRSTLEELRGRDKMSVWDFPQFDGDILMHVSDIDEEDAGLIKEHVLKCLIEGREK